MDEQAVSEAEEFDGLDDTAIHFLAGLQDEALGTARLRLVQVEGKDWAKLERIAVLKAARGQGLGAALVEALLAEARAQGVFCHRLGAQLQALPFYEKLGFKAVGEVFMDAHIPHRQMIRIESKS